MPGSDGAWDCCRWGSDLGRSGQDRLRGGKQRDGAGLNPRDVSPQSDPGRELGRRERERVRAIHVARDREEGGAADDQHHRQRDALRYAERDDQVERPSIGVGLEVRDANLRKDANRIGESFEHRLKRPAPERLGAAVDPRCLGAKEPDPPTEEARVGGAVLEQETVQLGASLDFEGWANDLEIKAGAELNRFLFEDGAANARLLRRWIWFFCAKAAWIDSRTEALRSGPLQPMLKGFADPIRVLSQVRVAHLEADPDRWAFHLVVPLGVPEGVPLSMMLVIRGTAFFAVPRDVDGTNPLPFPTTELTAGIRLRRDVPRIQAGAVALLPATQAILTAAPEI